MNPSKVMVIAEAACTWLHGGLEAASRSIKAAAACGASAWKTQWTSDPEAMAMRRGAARDKYTRLGWAGDCLPKLKAMCDEVGIEFMCTVFIPKDIPLIAPYVSRFKVSAFESTDKEFIEAHRKYAGRDDVASTWKQVIVSMNPGKPIPDSFCDVLHCVSEYPTPLENLKLLRAEIGPEYWKDGLSDHTTSTLTGAVAVGAGARIIEKHVRLSDTPSTDPDYGHSLVVDFADNGFRGNSPYAFKTYVDNIREAERML